jgi:hypothetical protein
MTEQQRSARNDTAVETPFPGARHASKIDAKKAGMSDVNGLVAPAGCHVSLSVSSSGRSPSLPAPT